MRERRVSTAKREGKAVGRRETFITTLTGLCVYSATVALASRRPLEVSEQRGGPRVSRQPLAEFPARRVTVRRLFNPCHTSHPPRERIFHFIRRGHRSPSLRSVPSEARVLVNIISWPSTCIALRPCQRRDPPRCTTLPLISPVRFCREIALMLYRFMISNTFVISWREVSRRQSSGEI